MSTRPLRFAIDHDEFYCEFVGTTADGRQFFLTTPFVAACGGVGSQEFVALYIFDESGVLIDAKIDAFGPRATMDRSARQACRERRLSELGLINFERIFVEPFRVNRFGVTFGLIDLPPEGERDYWTVSVEPGNYMVFFEPWDSGIYDT